MSEWVVEDTHIHCLRLSVLGLELGWEGDW